ncbi:DHH family phosphoesterase [Candidatus Peregrinibacteria bacterium]|nr:DHH family phosphoesterase [Candidatus Peregrinibacteria bacterium]
MNNFKTEFFKTKDLLRRAQKIVIISHRGPDGDTIGANLSLRLALKYQWNKNIISACVDPVPSYCDFLPEVKEFRIDFDQAEADALVFVDCGASYMSKFHEKKTNLFSGSPPVINIDHHASNDNFGQINIVNSDAASTTEILYEFFKFCGFKITADIATCLLNGLYFDTGSFMHSNTTPEVLNTASELLWRGADAKIISSKQFHTNSISQMKLYGRIFERMRVNNKKVISSAVSEKDFDETGAKLEDTTGAIDYLNSVPDGNMCCLLYEDRKGVIKGSFRTRADIDLAMLAQEFGGGGHKKAAGFSFPGHLIEINPRVKIGP